MSVCSKNNSTKLLYFKFHNLLVGKERLELHSIATIDFCPTRLPVPIHPQTFIN